MRSVRIQVVPDHGMDATATLLSKWMHIIQYLCEKVLSKGWGKSQKKFNEPSYQLSVYKPECAELEYMIMIFRQALQLYVPHL